MLIVTPNWIQLWIEEWIEEWIENISNSQKQTQQLVCRVNLVFFEFTIFDLRLIEKNKNWTWNAFKI